MNTKAFLLLLLLISKLSYAAESDAPPLRCAENLSAWCIVEGAAHVTSERSETGSGRMWLIRTNASRRDEIFIYEPKGCRATLADSARLLAIDEKISVRGQFRDRFRIRLSKKGQCDLELYISHDEALDKFLLHESLFAVRGCMELGCQKLIPLAFESQILERLNRQSH